MDVKRITHFDGKPNTQKELMEQAESARKFCEEIIKNVGCEDEIKYRKGNMVFFVKKLNKEELNAINFKEISRKL